jgi:hypothetical protein
MLSVRADVLSVRALGRIVPSLRPSDLRSPGATCRLAIMARIIYGAAVSAFLAAACGGLVRVSASSVATHEPDPAVLRGAPRVVVRVCESTTNAGITIMDEAGHYLIDGISLRNIVSLGCGVHGSRVRGISDQQDRRVAAEIIGVHRKEVRFGLISAAVCAAEGCQASKIVAVEDVIELSRGTAAVGIEGRVKATPTSWRCDGAPLARFGSDLERLLGIPVQTNPRDQAMYKLEVVLPEGVGWTDDAALLAIQEQTGVKILRTKRNVTRVEVSWLE